MDESEQLDTSQKSEMIALLLQHGAMIKMGKKTGETKRDQGNFFGVIKRT